MKRPYRDIFAEAMRRERLGQTPPAWETADEEFKEGWRLRADRVIRIIGELGGPAVPPPPLKAGNIVVDRLLADRGKERIVRRRAGKWEIVLVDRATHEETIEFAFTLIEVGEICGEILTNAPEITKRAGVGRILAAALEIYRLDAATMETTE